MVAQSSSVEQPTASPGAVLISGASFAGLATAYWLNRLGHDVTIVEVAKGLRQGGTPVDIEGDTIAILTRMDLLEQVRSKALPPRRFEFKNADDGTIGAMSTQPDPHDEKYEIHRDDLLAILFSAVKDSVEIVFSRSIRHLENGSNHVAVTFDDGSRIDYALVIGCDGSRSNTRRLAFDDTDGFSHFMGCYFFMKVVPETGLLPADTSQIFSVPGRTAVLNGYADRTDIALAFRSNTEIDYDYRDRAGQRRMVHEHFDALGWKVPAMLAHLDADDAFYFDTVNQIRMPTWSKGRVALVGDAGYCVSPVAGMGGSMAIIGAAGLADALAQHGSDYTAAFGQYHETLHPFVDAVQDKAVSVGMAIMFPSDDADMTERDRKIAAGELEM